MRFVDGSVGKLLLLRFREQEGDAPRNSLKNSQVVGRLWMVADRDYVPARVRIRRMSLLKPCEDQKGDCRLPTARNYFDYFDGCKKKADCGLQLKSIPFNGKIFGNDHYRHGSRRYSISAGQQDGGSIAREVLVPLAGAFIPRPNQFFEGFKSMFEP